MNGYRYNEGDFAHMIVSENYLNRTAKEYYSQDRLFGTRALAWIIYNNRLSIPTGERALSVCTMVFEVK